MSVIRKGMILEGRYRVDDPIGAGGFATVHAGFHLTLEVPVAIKVLHVGAEAASEFREEILASFVEEARLVTRLRHDHVVRTLDQGVLHDDGGHATPYVVLEWCGDESLRQHLLGRGAALPLDEAYAIIDAIADGMAHAHQHGVVHRDLKPSNVMLARDREGAVSPRIIDFGIAKLFESDERGPGGQTMSQSPGKFTPAYAAPEQLAGLRTGPWTDVHAIGLLFYELVTGRAPFDDGPSLRGIDPERPSPARLGVDVGAFEAVIARAVALRPTERYADAGELRQALHEAAEAMALTPNRSTRTVVVRSTPPNEAAASSAPTFALAAGALSRTTPLTAAPKAPRLAAPPEVDTAAPISRAAEGSTASERASVPSRSSPLRRRTTGAVVAFVVVGAGVGLWLGTRTRAPDGAPVEALSSPDGASTGGSPSVSAISTAVEPTAVATVVPSPADAAPSAIAAPLPSASSSGASITTVFPLTTKTKPPGVVTTVPASATAVEPHAPSVSASKGVGGIVEQPPF